MSRPRYLTIIIFMSISLSHMDEIHIKAVETEIISSPWIDPMPKNAKEKIFKRAEAANNMYKEKIKRKTKALDNEKESQKLKEGNTIESGVEKLGPPEPEATKPRRMIHPPFDGIGPSGFDDDEATTCDQFSANARFNPYSVGEEKWFAFYFWTGDTSAVILQFKTPIAKTLDSLHEVLDPQVLHPINWKARNVLMIDVIHNTTGLLVERGDRGQYWLYPYVRDYPEKIVPADVRLKQTSDNKYIGFMECESESVYVLARLQDIPPSSKIQDEASKIGYRGRLGRSYLYQGHHWMPIPEMDELEYWAPLKYRKDINLPHAPEDGNHDHDENILTGPLFEM